MLATHYDGKELNRPNDIVVDSQGRIWFTDPTYGRSSPTVGVPRECPLGFQSVYRLDEDGTVTLLAKDFLQPNGLCFDPGERTLLVNDAAHEPDVVAVASLTRNFFTLEGPRAGSLLSRAAPPNTSPVHKGS